MAAWLCANSPQAATITVFNWLDGARHFSHQQRLTREVAFLLAGVEPRETVAQTPSTPEEPKPPTFPVETALKRLDLAVERTSEAPSVVTPNDFHDAGAMTAPELLGVPPPHEPPRGPRVA